LAEVSEADEVVVVGDGEDGSRQGSDSVEDPASDRKEALEENNELDEFNDDFDEYYGTLDFGYEDSEFTIFPDIDLRPSADATGNVSACASAAMIGIHLDHLDELQQHHLCKVISKFPKLFSDDPILGHVPGVEHRIVTNDSDPICVRQWRLPEKTKAFIRDECDKMRDEGVIEPSSSPWLSPVVLVRKKNGTTRFCIDFRGLNAATVADSYPMPRIDELIDELRDTSWFTVLDAKNAYWSISVAPEDRPKTAFSDGHRLWQFRRLPFGLATAPSTFQRTINMVLSAVLGRHTVAYLDDVVVHSSSFEEHLEHLTETLHLLNKAGFRLNREKCEFATREFKFLGFKVTPEGILPDPDKVIAINNMPAPRTVKEVRRFLGCSGYFRKHIPNYAALAAPLTRLTRKDAKFVWTDEEEKAFNTLKQSLVEAPVLKKPNFTSPFEVHCDASKLALGACLMQRGPDDIPHAVAYFSRKLRGPETRYPAIDIEALAVIEGVRAFDHYLYGNKFLIFTDHRPLTFVFHRRTKSPRMSKWSHELSNYQYKLLYKKGSSNHVPDCLSRVANIDASALDPQKVRDAQLKDPLWREVIQYLEERAVPRRKLPLPLEEFELINGILYHVRHLPDRLLHQLVIPRELRDVALKLVHSSPLGAHSGVYRTYCKIRDLFYFPNLLRETRQFVRSCAVCQRRKGPAYRQAPMANAPDVNLPLERVSADLMDLHSSTSGNRYVLSIVDHMTRYLQLIPLPCKSAETVAEAFINNFVTLFGPPRVIQTDNGSEFCNRLFQQVCSIIQTKMSFTTVYHAQANGMIERTNRVVKDALATLTESRPDTWDQYLPQVRLALNSSVHRSIREQPIYLMTGHHGHFPLGPTNDVTIAADSAKRFQERLQVARSVAVETSSRAREGWARIYNKRVRKHFQPNVGVLVWVKVHPGHRRGPGRALGDRWRGPARIMKRIGPVSYLCKEVNEPYRELKCHINQLKEFVPEKELQFTDDVADNSLPLECGDWYRR